MNNIRLLMMITLTWSITSVSILLFVYIYMWWSNTIWNHLFDSFKTADAFSVLKQH